MADEHERPSYCPRCGGSVYYTRVRLTGGTITTLPVDMSPWDGSETALRLHRDSEGSWSVNGYSGQWQAHRCS